MIRAIPIAAALALAATPVLANSSTSVRASSSVVNGVGSASATVSSTANGRTVTITRSVRGPAASVRITGRAEAGSGIGPRRPAVELGLRRDARGTRSNPFD